MSDNPRLKIRIIPLNPPETQEEAEELRTYSAAVIEKLATTVVGEVLERSKTAFNGLFYPLLMMDLFRIITEKWNRDVTVDDAVKEISGVVQAQKDAALLDSLPDNTTMH